MPLVFDPARLPSVGDTIGDKYRLECVLGSGGMGVVFGATHVITHKRVAIKWLAVESSGSVGSDSTRRFLREARLAGEFQHPNVVQVYDFGKSNDSFFMVMEWLDGESLATRLERVKRLSFRETLECLIPCMHAMERAHQAGIIHRDLKPANIFLCRATADKPPTSKVLDFGISKRIATGDSNVSSLVTKTGMLIGTPQYLSPEQLRSRPVDRRTDVYGFGVMLYETLAGVPPFKADNFGDLVVQISTSTPKPLRELLPHLPLGVEEVVARAMAREPEVRFGSVHELAAALEAIDPSPLTASTLPRLETTGSLAPVTTEQPDAQARPRKSWRTLYGLGLASAIGASALILMSRQDPSPPTAASPEVSDDHAGSAAAATRVGAKLTEANGPTDGAHLRAAPVRAQQQPPQPPPSEERDAATPALRPSLQGAQQPAKAPAHPSAAPEHTISTRPAPKTAAKATAPKAADKPREEPVPQPTPATHPPDERQPEPLGPHRQDAQDVPVDDRLRHNPLDMKIQ